MTFLLVALGLLTVVLLLLAVPVSVVFQLERTETLRGRISIQWLLGLVRLAIPIPQHSRPLAQSEMDRKVKKPRRKRRRSATGPNALAVLRQAAFRRRACRFVTDLIRAMHPRQLRLSMRLGLGDPADTGCLWAFVGPLGAAAQNIRDVDVQIEPEFIDATFDFNAHGQLRLIPLQFLILIIMFAFSPSSIRAWRTLTAAHA